METTVKLEPNHAETKLLPKSAVKASRKAGDGNGTLETRAENGRRLYHCQVYS